MTKLSYWSSLSKSRKYITKTKKTDIKIDRFFSLYIDQTTIIEKDIMSRLNHYKMQPYL